METTGRLVARVSGGRKEPGDIDMGFRHRHAGVVLMRNV